MSPDPSTMGDALAAEDPRPRWFAVAPGLRGPAGMIWHGAPVPRPRGAPPYLFAPLELSAQGRALTLDQLMTHWRQHADVPHLPARAPTPASGPRRAPDHDPSPGLPSAVAEIARNRQRENEA